MQSREPPDGGPWRWTSGYCRRTVRGTAARARRVFNRLALIRGAVVTLQDLIEAAYGDQLDGGPLRAKNNVRVTMFRLRRRGIRIRICRGRGYVLL